MHSHTRCYKNGVFLMEVIHGCVDCIQCCFIKDGTVDQVTEI